MHYLQLSDGGLKGVLLRTEKAGQGYRKFLRDYPEVMCEPLERYYLLRRATCKLDVLMLDDLLFGGSWREANWGAWLTALAPRKEYIELLERRKPTLPYGHKVINLALASCGKNLPDDLNEHFELLQEVRTMLNELPLVQTPMRRALNNEEAFRSEVELVRETYKSVGPEDARNLAKKGLLGYYSQSYKDWLKSGAPSLSEWLEKNPALSHANALMSERNKPWWKIW